MHNHLRKYANIAGTGCFSAALDSNGGCPTLLAGAHCIRQVLWLPLYKRWLTAELVARSPCPRHQTGWRAPSHHPLQGQDFVQHTQPDSLGRTSCVQQTGRGVSYALLASRTAL